MKFYTKGDFVYAHDEQRKTILELNFESGAFCVMPELTCIINWSLKARQIKYRTFFTYVKRFKKLNPSFKYYRFDFEAAITNQQNINYENH